MFFAKIGFLVLLLLLELWPMVTLVRWRRGVTPDVRRARRIAGISYAQAALVVLMVFAATAMARGIGAGDANR
jgi:putative membrane protein